MITRKRGKKKPWKARVFFFSPRENLPAKFGRRNLATAKDFPRHEWAWQGQRTWVYGDRTCPGTRSTCQHLRWGRGLLSSDRFLHQRELTGRWSSKESPNYIFILYPTSPPVPYAHTLCVFVYVSKDARQCTLFSVIYKNFCLNINLLPYET